MKKLGIIDVGGGYRGIYAAGVLDYCMDEEISFDLGIGVSAGSFNLLTYAAHQRGRNYQFYTDYGLRKEYAGLKNFLTKKSFIDLDYAGSLCKSDGENPLDYDALMENPMELYIVATEAEHAQPRYFSKKDLSRDNYDIMKASCALPAACQPYLVKGTAYFDGAVGDPVPIRKAMELGCDKVVVMLTRPEDVLRTPYRDEKMAHFIRRQYPEAAENLCLHADKYNEEVAFAEQLAAEGKVLIVAPDDTCGVTTLTRDLNQLKALYQKGYEDGTKIKAFLSEDK